jgi:hypothetical protein
MNCPVHPFIALPVPGAIVIMASPIGIDRERHYGNAEPRRIRIERNITALVLVSNVGRVNPAAIAVEGNITPAPIIQTTHDLNGAVSIELCNLRI